MSDDNDLKNNPKLPEGSEDELPLSTEPSAATNEHEQRAWLKKEVNHSRRGVLIAAIVAAVVVVVGGGWAAYALWYQNPDNVVMAALGNALNAKTVDASGTYSSHGDKGDVALTFTGTAGYVEGAVASGVLKTTSEDHSVLSLDGSFVASHEGDYYAKVNHLKALYDKVLQDFVNSLTKTKTTTDQMKAQQTKIAQMYETLFGSVVTKVDGKWVKFSAQDVKNIDPKLGSEYDCSVKVIKNLGNEKSKRDELAGDLQKNRFITIKKNLGSKNGESGFVVAINKAAATGFVKSLKTTQLYENLRACTTDGKLDIDNDILNNLIPSGLRVEVWVDQLTHQLKSVYVSGTVSGKDSKVTIKSDITTKFDEKVKIDIPKGAIDFKDALPDMTTMFKSYVGA
jgi:hypothetical protein